MRAIFSVLLLVALGLGVARAEEGGAPSEADAAAIRGVIEAQMQAFGRDDGAAAFAFASPGIQAMFGDAERFMDMVRSGYQPVYRPRSHCFGTLRSEGRRIVQDVDVLGPDGRRVRAHYFMQRETDGAWRIDGCVLEALSDTEA
jgi:hypothetical protein